MHSSLNIAQASSYFKCLNMHMFMYATPTFITGVLCLVNLRTAAFNDHYSELMVYIAVSYSYWVSFHDVNHY